MQTDKELLAGIPTYTARLVVKDGLGDPQRRAQSVVPLVGRNQRAKDPMAFFQDFPIPTQPKRGRQGRFVPPPWSGTPRYELPALVHIGQFLYFSPTKVIAVKGVEVFSTGCNFDLTWIIRRADETDEEWEALNGVFFQHGFRPKPEQNLLDVLLLFGVELPDGSRAFTGAHGGGRYMDPTQQPTAPVLSFNGGGGSGGDDELAGSGSLWLWPLPEEGDLRLVTQWPALGIEESSLILDGGQLKAAAAGAKEFWPGEYTP